MNLRQKIQHLVHLHHLDYRSFNLCVSYRIVHCSCSVLTYGSELVIDSLFITTFNLKITD